MVAAEWHNVRLPKDSKPTGMTRKRPVKQAKPAELSKTPKVKKTPKSIAPHIERLADNHSRVTALVIAYETLYGRGRGRKSIHKLDLLRAAVVFLHASLEDFLRSIALVYLPKASEQVLNEIPLKGSRAKRAEKFSLGRLSSHRGILVDTLIRQSVEEHLERSSFNDVSQIANLVQSIGLDVDYVSGSFPDLQALMKRRHQIVHQADRVKTTGKGTHRAQSINPKTVNDWKEASWRFASRVLYQIYVLESQQAKQR